MSLNSQHQNYILAKKTTLFKLFFFFGITIQIVLLAHFTTQFLQLIQLFQILQTHHQPIRNCQPLKNISFSTPTPLIVDLIKLQKQPDFNPRPFFTSHSLETLGSSSLGDLIQSHIFNHTNSHLYWAPANPD